jgi:L-2,4-diaminobutyrate decarboxylase
MTSEEERENVRFIEPDGSNREAIRRLGYRFVDLIVEAEADAGSKLAVPDASEEPIPFEYSPPEAGRSADELIESLQTHILGHVLNPANPGYVGHMDSLASSIGIFSDALVSAFNNNMLSYEMSLVFTRMERTVLDWAMRRFGWERDGHRRGFLVSGGTLANIQALWVARNARAGNRINENGIDPAAGRPVVIASEHAHYSFLKASNLLGFGRRGFRAVPVDAGGCVDPARVEDAIAAARRDGMNPFCLIGVAGTTITGTIEPLERLGEIARKNGMWFHVDAAYGGSIILSDRLRERLRGCESADSITWNPQKWLYVPKTCASILFRDGRILEDTVREPFVYGRETAQGERPNLGEYTIQGTRRVDVLKLWLTLEHLGTEYLDRLITQDIERARWFARKIADTPGFELVNNPDLSIVCFRVIPDGWDRERDAERLDEVQVRVQRAVAERGHGWLSLPTYRGRRVLRAVVLHPRCSESVLGRLLEDAREAAVQLAKQAG